MWVAKPLSKLSFQEKAVWESIDIPLSQSLSWAKAMEAVGAQVFLVFSPEERVGGIVFSTDSLGHFECINGPLLDWEEPSKAPRQFATFAMAVSKLDRGFKSLSLKPRWEETHFSSRLAHLPIAPLNRSEAATILVPIQSEVQFQFQKLTPRLQRSIQNAKRNDVKTRWEAVTEEILESFVPSMQDFAQDRGFIVPPFEWWKALILGQRELQFWIGSAQKENLASSQILVVAHKGRAHYLFGYDQRIPEAPARISPAAAIQWEALRYCSLNGINTYDLNGYIANVKEEHPYFGVCKFKEQFAGRVVRYFIPEFSIS